MKPFRYVTDDDRDPMRDEENAAWAVNKIRQLDRGKEAKPFFMGVGFSKPHTALVAPQKYFDMFPLDELKLPAFKEGDTLDCHFADNVPSDMKGFKFYKGMVAAFGDFKTGLRKYLQAYLACVAFADDQVGKVLTDLEKSRFSKNTIVIFTSDHGYDFGQKEYLFKNTVWEDSTRVPLLIRVPGAEENAGKKAAHPVSLIDIYPTLVDLCQLKGDTKKNDRGADLNGHSVKPFIQDPENGKWTGPDVALTVVASKNGSRIGDQNYAVRSKDWRYILYQDGQEELYDHRSDPHEWTNLRNNPQFRQQKQRLRNALLTLVFTGKKRGIGNEVGAVSTIEKTKVIDDGVPTGAGTSENKEWIKKYFKQHPAADENKDGILTWPELSKHKGRKNKNN
jgi:arylsulfatase A-like enzyme